MTKKVKLFTAEKICTMMEVLTGKSVDTLHAEIDGLKTNGYEPRVIQIPRFEFFGVQLEFADVEETRIVFEPTTVK